MRRVAGLVGAALMLAGCGSEVSPEDQAAADQRDVALVQAANKAMPPVRLISPEPILLPDIERYDMLGESCTYAPGTSLGARVIAREADAFMKIDGEIERFAADPGSRELPMHTRSVYNGKAFSVVLALTDDTAKGAGQTRFEGAVTVRDAHGRIVYEGVGEVQCTG